MNARSIIGNFSVALAAQTLNIVVSVLFTLFLPKVLGIAEFGYWQLFLFYASYMGFFHLGLNDGVYLIKGGQARDEIDKCDVNSQFRLGMTYQLVFAVIIVAIALIGPFESSRQFVIGMTALYLLINNAQAFFGLVFQAMNETRLYSATVAINAMCFLIPLIPMLVMGYSDFELYVVFYTAARTVSLIFCVWKGTDILKSGTLPLSNAFSNVLDSIRIGVKLMIANITGMLILGIARFVVDASWGIETFSIFSFAINMVTFFMMFISQAAMVLFPALRQSDSEQVKSFFQVARNALDLFLPLSYVLYFPAVLLLQWWLPQYEESFSLFALLLPICVFNGKMDIVGTTYLKVLRKEGMLLAINCITLVASSAGVSAGAYLLNSLEATIGFAVVALILRSVFTEWWVGAQFKQNSSSTMIGVVAMTILFIALSGMLSFWLAFAVTSLAYLAYLLAFGDKVKKVVRQARSAIR